MQSFTHPINAFFCYVFSLEFATVVKEFKNEEGNIVSQTFLTSFLRLGAEERARVKKVELEKQRREEHHRKVSNVQHILFTHIHANTLSPPNPHLRILTILSMQFIHPRCIFSLLIYVR